jgi:hypothetical protein
MCYLTGDHRSPLQLFGEDEWVIQAITIPQDIPMACGFVDRLSLPVYAL